MSDTDEVDTVFEGIDIEGQNPKVQESEDESIGTMSEESSDSQDGVEDTSVDTDFSNVDIEGSTPVSDDESPVISTDDTGLGSNASETWGGGESNIRVDEEELSETVETSSTSDDRNSGFKSEPDSNDTEFEDGDTVNEADTDFSNVHIDGSVTNADVNSSDEETNEEFRTNTNDQSEARNPDSAESTTELKDEITKEVTTDRLDEVSSQRVRSPLEILTGPFRGIINSGEFILGTFSDLVILYLIATGYLAKITISLGVLLYGVLTAFVIVFPPLLEMHFVANGVVNPNPTRLELFMVISLVFIPILLILRGFTAIGRYLRGDTKDSSTEDKGGFSRW